MEIKDWNKFYRPEDNFQEIKSYENYKYVNVYFSKGKYLFCKLKGQEVYKIRKGKTFATVPRPVISKRGYRLVGWFVNDKMISENYVINESIVVTPYFEKI